MDIYTINLEDLDLSVRAVRCLKYVNVETLGQASELTKSEIMNLRNINRRCAEEIIAMLEKHGLEVKETKDVKNPESVRIENLDLTLRTYNCLTRAGISTLGDVSMLTKAELEKVRNINGRCVEEIVFILKNYGLKLKD